MAMLLLKSHWPYLGPIDKVPGLESLGLGLACLFFLFGCNKHDASVAMLLLKSH